MCHSKIAPVQIILWVDVVRFKSLVPRALFVLLFLFYLPQQNVQDMKVY